MFRHVNLGFRGCPFHRLARLLASRAPCASVAMRRRTPEPKRLVWLAARVVDTLIAVRGQASSL
jgi:hypothetical protein